MQRTTEIELLKELIGLKESRSFFLDTHTHQSAVERYYAAEQFAAEQEAIFTGLPLIAAHSSELPSPGSFVTRDLAGLPLLLTRDSDGTAHAFLNVCRHRGSRLVADSEGCKRAFSCPYHAWTWSNDGILKGIPHQKEGFPDLERDNYGLKRLPMLEVAGMIWVTANPDSSFDIGAFLEPILADFAWFNMPNLALAASDVVTINANWKTLVEGGIEAYHFKVAHKNTIGPHFLDNLSSYQPMGHHMRSILAKNSLRSLADKQDKDWYIREHSNVLYSIFPLDQFLLMEDHSAWISSRPLSPDQTEVRLSTLAPKDEVTPERLEHWRRNHQITVTTLQEDFALNESAQLGLRSGANTHLTFGRYEGALAHFNAQVDAIIRNSAG